MHIIETHAAPSPRRVNIFLAEKGIVVPREERDMMTEDLKSGDFAKLNPWHRVPVLVFDDGRTISETIAICRYFEEIKPEPPLFGVGAIGKAEVEMWTRRVELGLSSAVFSVFRHLHPKMAHLEVPQVAEWGEANKEKVAFELGRLDARLADSRFIAGDDYTIADITALVAVDFMRPARLGRPDAFANVTRWHGEVSARPSAKA
ncbi:glutathione S-transferase [Hyphomicrobium sp. B1]|uniref:glutathione S-transferase n=1 Tax=Hyphomicrobium sp. B1 TaxID=3075651 RepID=UPI003C2B1485